MSPCPSRPYSPKPHVYNSPLLDMAAECELPHAMSLILLLRKLSIIFGLSRLRRLPWPNFPSSPSPHENTYGDNFIDYTAVCCSLLTFPSNVKAKACFPPEWTATFLTTYWLKKGIGLGKPTLLLWPSPNLPFVPSPQA